MELTSDYGPEFDRAANRWRALEREHDRIHPDRNECRGVGACSMMRAAYDIQMEMVDALNEWRLR